MSGRRSKAARRGLALVLTAKPGALAFGALNAQVAGAADIPVLCTVASLKTAITNANATVGNTNLVLPAGGSCTYDILAADTAGEGLPVITGNISITGNGDTVTRDAGAGNFRIFHVQSTGTLNLSNLTVSNGVATSGGGVFNDKAILTVTNSTITGNRALNGLGLTAKGGGILSTGMTTLTNSRVTGNAAAATGTVASQSAPGYAATGGGISAKGGKLTLTNTTVSGNTAVTNTSGRASGGIASGGGISAKGLQLGQFGPGPTVVITGTTVSGNTASATAASGSVQASGGGIEEDNLGSSAAPGGVPVTMDVANTTITGNTVVNGSTGINKGGGINFQGVTGDTLTVTNSTVAGNTSTNSGIDTGNANRGTTTVTNTILASNSGGNCLGTITDGGHNISFPATDSSCPAGFAPGDPKLGPLANNGGLTQTMTLGIGSAAIDAASGAVCQAPLPTGSGSTGAGGIDQIGNLRAEVAGDTTCDVGAVEVQPAAAAAPAAVIPALPKAGELSAAGGEGMTPWTVLVPTAAAAGAAVALLRRRRPDSET